MPQPVLVAGARTPIGKLLGSLSALPAPALAGTAIRAALKRAGITGAQADAVIMGNVVQAGVGPNLPGWLLRPAASRWECRRRLSISCACPG